MYKKRVDCGTRIRRNVVSSKDLKLSMFYSPSPVDVFMMNMHENICGEEKSCRVTSDIYMLFNQQRLDRQSREALVNYFDNMSVNSPSLSSLRSKLTDDQLISLVKSRYISSMSELLEWSMYLNSLADSEIKAFLAAQQPAIFSESKEIFSESKVSQGVENSSSSAPAAE